MRFSCRGSAVGRLLCRALAGIGASAGREDAWLKLGTTNSRHARGGADPARRRPGGRYLVRCLPSCRHGRVLRPCWRGAAAPLLAGASGSAPVSCPGRKISWHSFSRSRSIFALDPCKAAVSLGECECRPDAGLSANANQPAPSGASPAADAFPAADFLGVWRIDDGFNGEPVGAGA